MLLFDTIGGLDIMLPLIEAEESSRSRLTPRRISIVVGPALGVGAGVET